MKRSVALLSWVLMFSACCTKNAHETQYGLGLEAASATSGLDLDELTRRLRMARWAQRQLELGFADVVRPQSATPDREMQDCRDLAQKVIEYSQGVWHGSLRDVGSGDDLAATNNWTFWKDAGVRLARATITAFASGDAFGGELGMEALLALSNVGCPDNPFARFRIQAEIQGVLQRLSSMELHSGDRMAVRALVHAAYGSEESRFWEMLCWVGHLDHGLHMYDQAHQGEFGQITGGEESMSRAYQEKLSRNDLAADESYFRETCGLLVVLAAVPHRFRTMDLFWDRVDQYSALAMEKHGVPPISRMCLPARKTVERYARQEEILLHTVDEMLPAH